MPLSYVVLVATVALAALGVSHAEERAAAPSEDDVRTRAGSLPVDPARPVCPDAPGADRPAARRRTSSSGGGRPVSDQDRGPRR